MKYRRRCLGCDRVFDGGFRARCPACDGAVETELTGAPRVRHAEHNPLRRYFEFLPLTDPDAAVWLGLDEPTPCLRAKDLGEALGSRALWLKDETAHPTRTTKDRMASVALSWFRENGVDAFSASSTGNSSTALARGVGRMPDLRVDLFCGEHFLPAMNWPDLPGVSLYVLRGATFVEASDLSRALAERLGSVMERGFFNPARRDGLKLAFFEASEQAGPFDCYVQGISSGMGLFGTWKGARELLAAGVIDRLPRLIAVQQSSCAPIARAWQEGSPAIESRHIVARPTGIARAMLRGDPTHAYPYTAGAIRASGGAALHVSEAEIRDARALLLEAEGVAACPAGATAVAGLKRALASGLISPDERVLLNITGGERQPTPPPPFRWVERRGDAWEIAGEGP